MKHLPTLILLTMAIFLLSNCVPQPEYNPQSIECYGSFAEFAFQPFQDPRPNNDAFGNYLSPWEFVSELPSEISFSQMQLVRHYEGKDEIWFVDRLKKNIVIYNIHDSSWSTFSSLVSNTNLSVYDIFVTEDQNIWGRVQPNTSKNNLNKETVLSKFNQELQAFEFVGKTSPIPFIDFDDYVRTQITLDRNDVFWIAVSNDMLYSYDTKDNILTFHTSLYNLSVGAIAHSTDGTIYLENLYPFASKTSPKYQIPNSKIIAFIVDTNEFVEVVSDDDSFLRFAELIPAKNGDVWIDSIGFVDKNRNINLVHPNPQNLINNIGDISWVTPHLVLESSNELLWFKKPVDQGTAWYDQKTQIGCVISNESTNVVEDTRRHVWIFVNRKLYSLDLEEINTPTDLLLIERN